VNYGAVSLKKTS